MDKFNSNSYQLVAGMNIKGTESKEGMSMQDCIDKFYFATGNAICAYTAAFHTKGYRKQSHTRSYNSTHHMHTHIHASTSSSVVRKCHMMKFRP